MAQEQVVNLYIRLADSELVGDAKLMVSILGSLYEPKNPVKNADGTTTAMLTYFQDGEDVDTNEPVTVEETYNFFISGTQDTMVKMKFLLSEITDQNVSVLKDSSDGENSPHVLLNTSEEAVKILLDVVIGLPEDVTPRELITQAIDSEDLRPFFAEVSHVAERA